MECQACQIGIMQKPPDDHPAYLLCSNCGALELTYSPLPYQEEIHKIPHIEFTNKRGEKELQPQIIFIAGGRKSHSPR